MAHEVRCSIKSVIGIQLSVAAMTETNKFYEDIAVS